MAKTLTDKRVRALRIIDTVPGVRPREFARAMWPRSRGWRRSTRAGRDRHLIRGGGMFLAAGSLLAILHKQKLLRRVQYEDGHGYVVSRRGQSLLSKVYE